MLFNSLTKNDYKNFSISIIKILWISKIEVKIIIFRWLCLTKRYFSKWLTKILIYCQQTLNAPLSIFTCFFYVYSFIIEHIIYDKHWEYSNEQLNSFIQSWVFSFSIIFKYFVVYLLSLCHICALLVPCKWDFFSV